MLTLLAVCTGNVCRSPAAERLLLARLAPSAAEVAVSSAGTHALVGHPIDPPVAELLQREGIDPAGFSARQLVPEHIRSADLVVVMTKAHRSAVVAAEPTAVRKTFLLRELAALGTRVAQAGWPEDVGEDPVARLQGLPRLSAVHRPEVTKSDLEVVDPYRRPADVYQRAVRDIATAVDELVTSLT
jgi:protein-tyrosine phosphatase